MCFVKLSCPLGSHTPSSEDLFPLLAGGCCYARGINHGWRRSQHHHAVHNNISNVVLVSWCSCWCQCDAKQPTPRWADGVKDCRALTFGGLFGRWRCHSWFRGFLAGRGAQRAPGGGRAVERDGSNTSHLVCPAVGGLHGGAARQVENQS